MKLCAPEDARRLPGIRLRPGERFRFRCHPGIGCFNRCCRNLRLLLYPYDVLRLKRALGLSSEEFLERHAQVALPPGGMFPEVLLRMAPNEERTCPFLGEAGCRVYADRPDTCRSFPLEQGLLFDAATGTDEEVVFFRPPDFCEGRHESAAWTVADWRADQQAEAYHRMTVRWARLWRRFQENPWGGEGPAGRRGRMAFMAAYNLDRFRAFVFESSFLERFRLRPGVREAIRTDDEALLSFGFAWIELFLWGSRASDWFAAPRR